MSPEGGEDGPGGQAGGPADTGPASATPYRVLARRYRPARFRDLIGQDALIRTLTNALEQGRMPQAFVMTGVRGTGKTTTARIIARALTCIGPDGTGGPTPDPCGVCTHCTAIAEDRHLDVIEMDAASRTGVDDIRDIIDGVSYRPVSARRKIYIVDEVHMLSRQAFNALLKTLEEPPEHITFVFATTEIRRVPVTVLSRCMRFDLRRVEHETMAGHLRWIAERESIDAEEEALAMMARAADGSVRDALSLMDQAVALEGDRITAEQVKQMLGLSDRTRIYDLYDAVLAGRAGEALDILAAMYAAGADPATLLQDMLEVTHTLTRLQVAGDAEVMAGLPETERTRGRQMADALTTPQLTRNWQILLKGLQETQAAPEPRQAAEMVLIRLMYAAELPPPGELVKQLRGQGSSGGQPAASSAPAGQPMPSAHGGPTAHGGPSVHASEGMRAIAGGGHTGGAPEASASDQPEPHGERGPEPASLQEIVQLCYQHREARLAAELRRTARPVRVAPGKVEVSPTEEAPSDLAGRLTRCLNAWTGRNWLVTLTDEPGDPTLQEQERQAEEAQRQEILHHPTVRRILETFPGAELVAHRQRGDGGPDDDSQGDGSR
ncbi:DNA polymerase-3 subunit gamma/tau [Limimonas halophila]|uniref:DNA polymerase III subunit gamma/tau n=1 Tax=Limimonas halophila TaxID=1082479 RepID=A0A1G7V6I1_9PROT|nr:DNA polymerase III subunit gamma/tau [Limimonas halophila]SDG55374.1 DNA polymerase-3 subunit gamma/tau [Limimonas halophila]